MPEGRPKNAYVTLHCLKTRNRSFLLLFLLDMRSKCGRVGTLSETAPFCAAVAAAVPEEEAAHARDLLLALSTPLRCPRLPHSRPFPTHARVSTGSVANFDF